MANEDLKNYNFFLGRSSFFDGLTMENEEFWYLDRWGPGGPKILFWNFTYQSYHETVFFIVNIRIILYPKLVFLDLPIFTQRWKLPIISVLLDFSSVFRFHFLSNRKSRRLDFPFLQIANLDTHTCPDFLRCVAFALEKIWTGMVV